MQELPLLPGVVRFEGFEADPRAGELRKQGRKIKLQEKPFQLLCTLLQHPGEVVTREELRERLWPADTFVVFDDNLNTAIKKLREALGDTAEHPRFVETLPRHGYRFIAAVESADGPSRPTAGLRLVWIASLAFVALVVVAFALNVGQWRERLFGTGSSSIRSLAVLPLENLSGDPEQDYFADGMTEALITELGKISALRVISRQSVMRYKSTEKSVPEIARELNVDAVVEGSALREGDRVRITIQLIQAAPESHVWAESYERDLTNILALQGEVARAIAREIRIAVTPEEEVRLAGARSVNPAAHEAYLKGRYHWNKRTEEGFKKGVEFFQESIEKDPGYALAYSGLADSYVLFPNYGITPPKAAIPRARRAAQKALEIDDTLAEAHTTLASIRATYDWDWVDAERKYKRAIELNPSYPTAHQWYAQYLVRMGRFREATTEMKRAQELDPLSLIINATGGFIFYMARQYDQAIKELRKTVELDPNFGNAHYYLGRAYVQKAMYGEAVAELEKAASLSGRGTVQIAELAHACAVAGKRQRALKILNELLRERLEKGYVSSYRVALVYVGLGEQDQALAWLKRAYDERSWWLGFLKVDPRLDPLRADPRFQDLLRRMNFPP